MGELQGDSAVAGRALERGGRSSGAQGRAARLPGARRRARTRTRAAASRRATWSPRRRRARSSARRSLEPVEGAAGPDVHLPQRGRRGVRHARRPAASTFDADPPQAAAGRAARRRRRPDRLLRPVRAADALRPARRGAACSRSARRASVAQRFAAQAVRELLAPPTGVSPACTRSRTPRRCCRHRRVQPRRRRAAGRPPDASCLLGLTSLLTDISSEMVVTILPLYLVAVGGFSPLAFGVIDGIYNGATAIVRLASGFIGDRWQAPQGGRGDRLRPLGGLQARCWSLVGTAVSAIGAVVLLDRVGQGHPHRAARRDDLAVDAEGAARHRVRRAPRDGHRRRDARPAAGLRAAGDRAARLRLGLPRLASASRSSASAILVLFVNGRGARAGRRRRPTRRAVAARRRRRCSSVPRFRARARRRRRSSASRRPATRSSSSRSRRSSTSARRCSRCCSSAAPARSCVLAVPIGRLADRDRPRPRCCSAATRCCSRVYASLLLPVGGWIAARRHARAARRVLRRDRRRPDGARQRRRARRGARQRPRAAGHARRASRGWSPRSPSARSGRCGASTPRSCASASALVVAGALAAVVLLARPGAAHGCAVAASSSARCVGALRDRRRGGDRARRAARRRRRRRAARPTRSPTPRRPRRPVVAVPRHAGRPAARLARRAARRRPSPAATLLAAALRARRLRGGARASA